MGKTPPKLHWKIQKDSSWGPDPGQYDTSLCIEKTQWRGIVNPGDRNDQRVVWFDKHKKEKSWVPGVGSYKKAEEGHNVIGKTTLYNKKGNQW